MKTKTKKIISTLAIVLVWSVVNISLAEKVVSSPVPNFATLFYYGSFVFAAYLTCFVWGTETKKSRSRR